MVRLAAVAYYELGNTFKHVLHLSSPVTVHCYPDQRAVHAVALSAEFKPTSERKVPARRRNEVRCAARSIQSAVAIRRLLRWAVWGCDKAKSESLTRCSIRPVLLLPCVDKVNYDALKKELKKNDDDRADFGEDDEAEFIRHLEAELDKVTGFHALKREELQQRLAHADLLVEKARGADGSGNATQEDLERIGTELSTCAQLLAGLDKWTKINYTAFLKILKKHDKVTNYALRTMFLMRMAYNPFYAASFDEELQHMSTLYSALGDLSGVSPMTPTTSEARIRRRFRFWVHPDNVTELKIRVLRHLPLVMLARKPDYDPGVSAVYLDTETFDCYKRRLEEVPGSEMIRIRWAGSPGQDLAGSKVMVERLTFGSSPGAVGLVERLELKEKYLVDFLAGKWTMAEKIRKLRERGSVPESEILAHEQLAERIQRTAEEKGLKSVVGTYYNRTAFRIVGDDAISVTLDTELAFFREDGHRTAGGWRRRDIPDAYPFKSLAKEECSVFPLALLEIEHSFSAGEEPLWIEDLLRSGLLEPVPRFSKFVHGLAVLMEDRVPLLPSWLPQLDRDIRQMSATRSMAAVAETTQNQDDIYHAGEEENEDGDEDEGESFDEDELESDEEERTVHAGAAEEGLAGQGRAPGARKKRVAVPVRVEPKVFFANERTLLSWLRFVSHLVWRLLDSSGLTIPHQSIILGGLAVGMLNFGDRVGQVSGTCTLRILRHVPPRIANHRQFKKKGALFSIVAMGIMLYSFALYVWRTRMIEIRYAGPYDDRVGPIVLVLSLYTCVLVNLWLKFDGQVQGVVLLLLGDK